MGIPFRIPNKWMSRGISGEVRLPNNLSLVVQPVSETADAAERAQIDHPALFPEERILRRYIHSALSLDWIGLRTRIGNTSDLPSFIHPNCERVGAAQIA